ncbi:MAG: hypothetical protein HY287_06470 [Planctomycetes bacterium]|nr:hypothetical protein [Planctomycetota bacterium]MBI3833957.1 hypothetical protein [Planctomycetota bacterium]
MAARFAVCSLIVLVTGYDVVAAPLGTAFTYQGQLKISGVPANGVYDFEFRLYDLGSGGAQLGNMVPKNDVLVENGLITTTLDFGNVFDGNQRFLEVRVRNGASTGAYTPLTPRQELTATPNALFALGGPVGSGPWQTSGSNIFNTNAGNVGIGTTTPAFPLTLQTPPSAFGFLHTDGNRSLATYLTPGECRFGSLGGNDSLEFMTFALTRMTITPAGYVGIGTATPAFPLTLQTPPSAFGFLHTDGSRSLATYLTPGECRFGSLGGNDSLAFMTVAATRMTITPGGNVGIGTGSPGNTLTVAGPNNFGAASGSLELLNTTPGTGRSFLIGSAQQGLFQIADVTAGGATRLVLNASGIVGIGTATPNAATQLNVVTNGSGFQAVRGDAANGNGVVGTSATGGYGATAGISLAADSGIGVYGQADAGVNAIGVSGHSTQGTGVTAEGLRIGLYATTSNGVFPNVAGQFVGDVDVVGEFHVSGTKQFRIDHPHDPENKYLTHYCTEGPEPLNVYRGTIRLDADGQAEVNLPDYFEDINKDFTYSLTAIGTPMPNLHIAAEVADNRFQIAGGTPGGKVCWQVSGVRNDLYLRRHGAPVETLKPADERGKYQHPELYGKPENMATHYRTHSKDAGQSSAPATTSGTREAADADGK